MSHAHVCDQCKTAAPLGDAIAWWSLTAIDEGHGAILTAVQKPAYEFCSWTCAKVFLTRMAPAAEGALQ